MLQRLKEAVKEKVPCFLIGFRQKSLYRFECPASLVEIPFFMYVFDNEMNELSHIDEEAGRFSPPPRDMLFPALRKRREGSQ